MRSIIYIGLIFLITACNHKNAAKSQSDTDSINHKIKIESVDISDNSMVNNEPYKLEDTVMINNRIFKLDSIPETTYSSINTRTIKWTTSIDTSLLRIFADNIIVKVADSAIVFKSDTSYGESLVKYKYGCTFPEINLIQIHASYWEWSREFLINYKNGEKIILWGNPNISPNKKHIISSSADLVACEMPNGIQLFKIGDGKIENIFEKEITKWEPSEIKWESDTSILIKIAIVDSEYQRHFTYRRMIIKD
jgi:hypothetical protein